MADEIPAPPADDAAEPAPKFKTGAKPSPPQRAFATAPFRPPLTAVIPDSFAIVPPKLDYWGNNQHGDCVTAEEAASKAAYSLMAGLPEVFIPAANVVSWARRHGFLEGAALTDVMDVMMKSGLQDEAGTVYTDGPYQAVDWTDDATLSAAIYQGPVKIAIASGQLQRVSGVGERNGWVATGFRRNHNSDHCVGLLGFGTAAALAAKLGITPPGGLDPKARCYLLFTWSTVGIIDRPSLIAITTEAWLRTPTTVGQVPAPVPGPTPTPTPPPPGPNGTPTSGTQTITYQVGVYSYTETRTWQAILNDPAPPPVSDPIPTP